jgi:hypothetical protein
MASMAASRIETDTTARPSPAAAYEVTAGPPDGIRSWTTQVHQFSGTTRPARWERSNTRATEVGEPGLTSTVHASKSSWQTASQCASTTLPNRPFTVMVTASARGRAGRFSGRVQSGCARP